MLGYAITDGSMANKWVRISSSDTGEVIADGPIGWGIIPFEGNFYIRRKYLTTDGFRVNYIPGLCIYKFLYVWLDLHLSSGEILKSLGWLYWLPNPLFPFIWYRVGLPATHPSLHVEEYSAEELSV